MKGYGGAGAAEASGEGSNEESAPDGRGGRVDESVLVVANHGNVEKIERHWKPLADVAADVTMVCVSTNPDVEGIRYRVAPAPGHRLVGVGLMLVLGLLEYRRGDYDAVASISLVPYGLFALVIGGIYRCPTHLGIIGVDLDRHAVGRLGVLVRTALRRFTSLSVPGTAHKDQLVAMGVEPDRITILANAIDVDTFHPGRRDDPTRYDAVWVGRFSGEKDPVLFVHGLAELRDRGVACRAVMIGSGPLFDDVSALRDELDLEESLTLAGWVSDPVEYYRDAEVYVLTSERDALPLTLLEAMALGMPSVVPTTGSIPDVADHRETAFVVPDMTSSRLADALETLLADEALRARLGENAPVVRDRYSYAGARDDWREILRVLRAEQPVQS